MDIVNKKRVPGGHGNAASEYSDIISRAESWARGADTATQDIDAEKTEEDNAFGVPNKTPVVYEKSDTHPARGGRTDGVK
jgi:hypothetical protein